MRPAIKLRMLNVLPKPAFVCGSETDLLIVHGKKYSYIYSKGCIISFSNTHSCSRHQYLGAQTQVEQRLQLKHVTGNAPGEQCTVACDGCFEVNSSER
jgi:hypothetical protein